MVDAKIVKLRNQDVCEKKLDGSSVVFLDGKSSLKDLVCFTKAQKAMCFASQLAEIAGYNMAGVIHRSEAMWVILPAVGLGKVRQRSTPRRVHTDP